MSKPAPKSEADTNDAGHLATNEAIRISGKRPRTVGILWFRGANLVLLAILPAGLAGIAVGATTVILRMAAPSAHLGGILAVWISTAIVSGLAIVAGLVEARDLAREQRKNHESDGK